VSPPPPAEPEEVPPPPPTEPEKVKPPPSAGVKPPPLQEVKPPLPKEVKLPRRKVALQPMAVVRVLTVFTKKFRPSKTSGLRGVYSKFHAHFYTNKVPRVVLQFL
jgi:hypothetical protein